MARQTMSWKIYALLNFPLTFMLYRLLGVVSAGGILLSIIGLIQMMQHNNFKYLWTGVIISISAVVIRFLINVIMDIKFGNQLHKRYNEN